MKTLSTKFSVLFLLVLFALSACSNNKSQINPHPAIKSGVNQVNVLDLKAIQPLGSISSNLKTARVILVGESHTNYAHHLNQLAVIKSAYKNWGKNTSIGLEMVQADSQQQHQMVLDDYVAGKISEREMLRGVQWYDRWKYDFRLYRPIFSFARQHKIPLIALNIPREITKRVSKVGIKGLNKAERSQLPKVLDKSNSAYVARIKQVFGMHAHGGAKADGNEFNRFLEAQLAWDEGMAFNATKYLRNNPAKRMVILAGSGHLINREGIPSRLDRQAGTKSVVILSDVDENPSAKQADYLLFSPEADLAPAGLIGISMEQTKAGVQVSAVSPKSAANKAGLLKGDIVLALNQQVVKTTVDVSLWRLDRKPGDEVKVKLRRKSQTLIKTLKLGKASSHSPLSMGRVHKK